LYLHNIELMNRKNILVLLACLVTTISIAQKKEQPVKPFGQEELSNSKKEAASYFKMENYRLAKTFYERLIVNDPKDVEFNYRLAVCYLNTNFNRAKAIPLLEYAANANSKDIPKDVLFELGKAYHYGNLFDKAIETFEKYRIAKKGSVDAKSKFDLWVAWSHSAKEIVEKPVAATFINPGKAVNSPTSDYKPVIGANDSVVYFSSSRKGNTGGLTDDLGDIPADVYFFTQTDSSFSKAKNAGANINTALYEECLYLNMTGDRMIIYMEGDIQGDLYISDIKGKQWNKAVSMGKEFVTKAYETGACLSPDGLTLYFAAEAENSKTGKDIYKCTRTEQTGWSKPERMGDNINTKEDEDAPNLWLDGKTLFFSSKGWGGIGGYDIYKSVMNDPSEGFGKPENIGYPLNSTYDDIGIGVAVDGKTIYLSQLRDSGIGELDIYKVKLEEAITGNKLCLVSVQAISPLNAIAKGGIVTVNNTATGDLLYKGQTNDANGKFDVALPTGAYTFAIRHPKLGKVEEEVLINAIESSKITKIMQFK
jgi:WD40-like Beta Propeller Repeat/Tetratricopeptide repeat